MVKSDKESLEDALDAWHISDWYFSMKERWILRIKTGIPIKNLEVLTEALKQFLYGCLHGTIICIQTYQIEPISLTDILQI